MDEPDTTNELRRKMDEARSRLPETTRQAIDSVDWRGVIAAMAGTSGYDLEQLSGLEMETELLLCGLTTPEQYPGEVADSMGIPRAEADKILSDMNERVFKKIKSRLMELTGPQVSSSQPRTAPETEKQPDAAPAAVPEDLPEGRDEILKGIEAAGAAPVHPLFAQKLSGPARMPSAKTIHSLDNLSSAADASGSVPPAEPLAPKKYEVDPYREPPE